MGAHLLLFLEVQKHLVDGPKELALRVDAEAYNGAFAGVGATSSAWHSRVHKRTTVELALEHLQRALRLFEKHGEEVAAVHFHLADAYVRQLQSAASQMAERSLEWATPRLAAGLKHAERAAQHFESSELWCDSAAAYRKLVDLRVCASEIGRSLDGFCRTFDDLVVAESRLLEKHQLQSDEQPLSTKPDVSDAASIDNISAAVVELRTGMSELLRTALVRTGIGEETGVTTTTRNAGRKSQGQSRRRHDNDKINKAAHVEI